ncbi:MAG: ArsR/SmtB family transcription factor [Pseudomonadota bacterium]
MLHHQGDLDRIFHALADPTRRAIVERLGEGPAAVSDLARPMEMTLTAVMQHLNVLEESGVIRTRKEGRRRICAVDKAAIASIEDWIAHRRASWEQRFDRLGDVLAAQKARKGKSK